MDASESEHESDSEFDESASDIDFVPSDSSFLEFSSDDSDTENIDINNNVENTDNHLSENTENVSGVSQEESIWSDYQGRHNYFQFDGIFLN